MRSAGMTVVREQLPPGAVRVAGGRIVNQRARAGEVAVAQRLGRHRPVGGGGLPARACAPSCAKKNSLFCLIGPPNVPPNWFRMFLGIAVPTKK